MKNLKRIWEELLTNKPLVNEIPHKERVLLETEKLNEESKRTISLLGYML